MKEQQENFEFECEEYWNSINFNSNIGFNINPKKVIVAIGKAGHGKSSFVKMFVSQSDRQKIKSGSDAQSITTQCQLYQIESQAKIRLGIPQKQITYIMDTPGLNSESSNYIVMNKIKRKLYLQNCDIIGIAYLRVASDFRDLELQNIHSFYKMFPVKKQIKDKISFFVLTQIDKQLDYLDEVKSNMSSLIKKYKLKSMKFIEKKHFYWMSFTHKQNILRNKINSHQECRQLFQNQWKQFSKVLSKRHQTYCSSFQFRKSVALFDKLFKQNIQKLLVIQPQIRKQQIQINLTTQSTIKDKIFSSVFIGVGGLSTLVSYQNFLQICKKTKPQFVNLWQQKNLLIGGTALGFGLIFSIISITKGFNNFCQTFKQAGNNFIDKLNNQKNKSNQINGEQKIQLGQLAIQYIKESYLKNMKFRLNIFGKVLLQTDKKIDKIIISSRNKDSKNEYEQKQIKKQRRKQNNKQIQYAQMNFEQKKAYKIKLIINSLTQTIILQAIKQSAQQIYGRSNCIQIQQSYIMDNQQVISNIHLL